MVGQSWPGALRIALLLTGLLGSLVCCQLLRSPQPCLLDAGPRRCPGNLGCPQAGRQAGRTFCICGGQNGQTRRQARCTCLWPAEGGGACKVGVLTPEPGPSRFANQQVLGACTEDWIGLGLAWQCVSVQQGPPGLSCSLAAWQGRPRTAAGHLGTGAGRAGHLQPASKPCHCLGPAAAHACMHGCLSLSGQACDSVYAGFGGGGLNSCSAGDGSLSLSPSVF